MQQQALCSDVDEFDAHWMGTYPVKVELLRKALGEHTWQTWLLAKRFYRFGHNRSFTMSRYGLTVRLKCSARQAKRAMAKLCEAGLVSYHHRRWLPVREGERVVRRLVPHRHVLGRLAHAVLHEVVLVPEETRDWLTQQLRRPGRGGKRAGAGRKPKLVEHGECTRCEHLGPHEKAVCRIYREIKKGPTPGNQKGATEVFSSLLSSLFLSPSLSSSKKDTPPERRDFLATPKTPEETKTMGTEPQPTPAVSTAPSTSVETAELGISLAKKPTWRGPPVQPGTNGVPVAPTLQTCPAVTIPAPPKLPNGLMGDDLVRYLARLYSGALRRYMGVKGGALPWRVLRDRYHGALCAAAEVMVEYDVTPAAWVMWSMREWQRLKPQDEAKRVQKAKRVPPIGWVFSAKRLNANMDAYAEHEEAYGSALLIFTLPARQLMERYERMRQELWQCGARTPEQVAPVVERHFPGDAYAQMVQAVRAEAAADQKLINEAVKKGEFVWA